MVSVERFFIQTLTIMRLVHPSALSSFAKYRQVRALLRQTNRASNSDWYRGPLSLDSQLHVFLSDTEFDQWVLHVGSEKKCKLLEPLGEGEWINTEAVHKWLQALLEAELPKKSNSLGIVIHLANDFALTELASNFNDAESLKAARDDIHYNPADVLRDRTLNPEERSFRLFPYAGVGGNVPAGVAVSTNRRYQALIQAFRDGGEALNFPVIVEALSAPLVSLSNIPKVITPPAERSFVCVLQYTNFSLLSFFSHAGNLMQLRTLRHRGKDYPPNIVSALSTMSSALGLANASYHILPLAGRAASKNLREIIFEQAPEMKPAEARMGLKLTDDGKHVRPEIAGFLPSEEEEKASLSPATKLTSAVSLTRKWVLQASGEGGVDIEKSTTFKSLTEDGWHLQDFMPPSREEIEILPNQSDIKLYKIGAILKKMAALFVIGFLGFTLFSAFRAQKDPAWVSNPTPLQVEKTTLAERVKSYQVYDDLFKDRSKAWSSIELVSVMFPHPKVIKLDTIDYSFKPSGGKGNGKGEGDLLREWVIGGEARRSAIRDLSALNSKEELVKIFEKVAGLTKDSSFNMIGLDSRDVEVDMETSTLPSKQDSDFDIGFRLRLTQIFKKEDSLFFGAKGN